LLPQPLLQLQKQLPRHDGSHRIGKFCQQLAYCVLFNNGGAGLEALEILDGILALQLKFLIFVKHLTKYLDKSE